MIGFSAPEEMLIASSQSRPCVWLIGAGYIQAELLCMFMAQRNRHLHCKRDKRLDITFSLHVNVKHCV
jgi:hypothetical protein